MCGANKVTGRKVSQQLGHNITCSWYKILGC